MQTPPAKTRPFLLDLLIILAAASVSGLLISLTGLTSLSNCYFLATVMLWIVAAVPIFGEVGGNTKTSFQARKEGKKARDVILQQEAQGKYSRGARITFLYGAGGFICLILAFVTTSL